MSLDGKIKNVKMSRNLGEKEVYVSFAYNREGRDLYIVSMKCNKDVIMNSPPLTLERAIKLFSVSTTPEIAEKEIAKEWSKYDT